MSHFKIKKHRFVAELPVYKKTKGLEKSLRECQKERQKNEWFSGKSFPKVF